MKIINNLEINGENMSEDILRNLYLRKLALGEIQGPPTGMSSIDKPWLKNYSEDAIIETVPKMTIYEYLKSCIEDDPDAVLIEYFGRKITSREILESINEYAKKFSNLNVKKGDYVALALPNTPESVYCIYALNKIGAIPCNIDPRENYDDLKRDIVNANAKYCVGTDMTYSKLKEIAKNYKLKSFSIVSPFASAPNKNIKFKVIKTISTFKNILEGNYVLNKKHRFKTAKLINDNTEDYVKHCDNDLAVIVHTGGTTGVHKGVKISNAALNQTVHDHKFIIDDIRTGMTLYNPLPQFMSYGMTTLHLSLCNKLCMYMMPVSSPKTFGKEISILHPEIIYGGPIHYQHGRHSKQLKEADMSTTKIAVSGGEKTTLSEEESNNEFYGLLGFQDEIFNGYGTSELCGVFSVKRGRLNSHGSVGQPLPKNNIKFVDDATHEEISYFSNKPGDIYINGASMMIGYDNAEETDKVIIDGWFETGDIGYMNQDGEIFITGRKKRQFVSGVDKVYAPDIEEKIEDLPFVEKCVVVGIADDELRKVPYAFVKLTEDYKISNQNNIRNEIVEYLKDKVPNSSIPAIFNFDYKFRYTPNGKVDFVQMEKEAEDLVKGIEKKSKVKKLFKNLLFK